MKISVVIPTHNSLYITSSVTSAFDQTLPPHEVIVIDDCSTDITLANQIASLETTYADRGLKVIRNSVNMGPSYSRNTGWDNASGELVAFLDANDRWKQNKLAVQASFMTSNAQYALTGHLNNFQKVTESREITFVDLLHQNTVQTSSIMIQRDIPVRFDPAMKYCEDHNFLIEVAYNYKIYFLGMVLGFLERPQLSPGGLSNNILEMRKGQLRIYVSQYKKHRIGLIKLIFMCTRSMAAHLLKLCSRFRETTGASS